MSLAVYAAAPSLARFDLLETLLCIHDLKYMFRMAVPRTQRESYRWCAALYWQLHASCARAYVFCNLQVLPSLVYFDNEAVCLMYSAITASAVARARYGWTDCWVAMDKRGDVTTIAPATKKNG